MTKEQRKRLVIFLIGLLCIVAIVSMYVWIMPKLSIEYKCPSKEIFNIECPGCGGTRMVQALLNGNIYQAFRYNPFLFITLPMLFILTIHQVVKAIRIGEVSIWLDKVLIIYTIMLILFGILRNIEIFSWLQPTEI